MPDDIVMESPDRMIRLTAKDGLVLSCGSSAVEITKDGIKLKGDVISLATYGAPELSTTTSTSVNSPSSSGGGSSVTGLKVGTQGEIVLPYLGAVKVAGLTPSEAAVYLEKELKDKGILVDPQVTVALVDSPTRAITVLGEVQRVGIGLNGIVQQTLLRIGAAQLDIVQSKLRMKAQADRFQIGRGGLRLLTCRGHGTPNAAP